jgi:hypothetical protein
MHSAVVLTALSSWYLVGLAVTVATTTYPSFSLVGEKEWPEFHRVHSNRISVAVGGAWVAQAVGILWWFAVGERTLAFWLTSVLAFLAVALTVGGAVNLHQQLSTQRTDGLLKRLRVVHLVRTLIWFGAALCATAPLW